MTVPAMHIPLLCWSVLSPASSWSSGLFCFTPTLSATQGTMQVIPNLGSRLNKSYSTSGEPLQPLAISCGGVTSWTRNKPTRSAGPGVAVHPVPYCHYLRLVARFLEYGAKTCWDPAARIKLVWGCFFFGGGGRVMATNTGDISVLCH